MTLALLIAMASLAGPPAASSAGTGPVRIEAPEMHYALRRREVVFTGNPVTLHRDDATLSCRRLVATNDARGQVAHAVCSGDVKFTRGERTVTCEKATYDDAEARVVCEGNPVLKDGPSEARGTLLVYDLRSDEVRLEKAVLTIPRDQAEVHRKGLEARRKEGGK